MCTVITFDQLKDKYENFTPIDNEPGTTTYLAQYRNTDGKVVIKVSGGEESTNLLHEIDVQKGLEHPNIVKILEVVNGGSNVGCVMEYCDAGNAAKLLEKQRLVNEADIRQAINELADALSFCHSKGVSHRGLTQNNVLGKFDGKGKVVMKVSDFRVARFDDEADQSIESQNWHANNDYKCDIFALGVLAYYFLSNGEEPFLAVNEGVVGELRFDQPIWQKRSPDARDFVAKLLEKDVNRRPDYNSVLGHPFLLSPLDAKFDRKLNLKRKEKSKSITMLPALFESSTLLSITYDSKLTRMKKEMLLNAASERVNNRRRNKSNNRKHRRSSLFKFSEIRQ